MCMIAWQGFSLRGGLAVVLRVQVWGTNPSMASAAAPGLHTNPWALCGADTEGCSVLALQLPQTP